MSELDIPSEFRDEWPDIDRVRHELYRLYTAQTGQVINASNPTAAELEALVGWFNANTLAGHFMRQRSVMTSVFSASLSAKISMLAQLHCPICATKEGLYPIQMFSIRIRPQSKQAIGQNPEKRQAFERAIRHRFRDHKPRFAPDQSICLLIVFVVKSDGRGQKDLDNMAKAIIDGVKTVLFGDDRAIDHLNIIRIKSPDEEFVYLNIRQTTLNDQRDVLVPRMLHSWAGAEALDLANFMDANE